MGDEYELMGTAELRARLYDWRNVAGERAEEIGRLQDELRIVAEERDLFCDITNAFTIKLSGAENEIERLTRRIAWLRRAYHVLINDRRAFLQELDAADQGNERMRTALDATVNTLALVLDFFGDDEMSAGARQLLQQALDLAMTWERRADTLPVLAASIVAWATHEAASGGPDDPGPKLRRVARNAAQCHECGDIIESTHRHDLKWCSCRSIAVDGGYDYTKRLFIEGAEWTDLAENDG